MRGNKGGEIAAAWEGVDGVVVVWTGRGNGKERACGGDVRGKGRQCAWSEDAKEGDVESMEGGKDAGRLRWRRCEAAYLVARWREEGRCVAGTWTGLLERD